MTTFNTFLYASIICRKPQQRYQLIDNKLITIDTVSILNVSFPCKTQRQMSSIKRLGAYDASPRGLSELDAPYQGITGILVNPALICLHYSLFYVMIPIVCGHRIGIKCSRML